MAVEDRAWGMEHASHILGEPIPLLSGQDLLILTAGGLLLVWDAVAFDLYIVRPGVTLEDLLDQISTRPGLPARLAPVDDIAEYLYLTYKDYWNAERRDAGRNRWAELRDRGGWVHEDWLREDRIRGRKRNT